MKKLIIFGMAVVLTGIAMMTAGCESDGSDPVPAFFETYLVYVPVVSRVKVSIVKVIESFQLVESRVLRGIDDISLVHYLPP